MPARAGIGLRAAHHGDLLARRPAVGWVEVHSENYFGSGAARGALREVREHYPVSLHGVGLGLGSCDALDTRHVAELRSLVREIEPWAVSEHVCWSAIDGVNSNDLLPLPRTGEALRHLVAKVGALQDALGRQVLLENVSTYYEPGMADYTEPQFLDELCARSGCALLLDVNNVYVNACNHGFDAMDYLTAVPWSAVREIHLAGHDTLATATGTLRIDTHDREVPEEVWALYAMACTRAPVAPALVEWDARLPALERLVAQASRADEIAETHRALAA